jgi:hypothetical protein
VLEDFIRPNFNEEEQNEHCNILRDILSVIVILFSSFLIISLARLLKIRKKNMNKSLEGLYAILNLRKEKRDFIRLHHPLFRDFLFNREKYDNLRFWVKEKKAHELLADGCLKLMFLELKRDIYNLQGPSVLIKDISD